MAETKKVAAASKSDVLGMRLARLDSGMRDSLGLGKDVEGVAILDVDADSPAAEKGLRKGDVIVRVGNTKVSDPASIVAGVKTAKLGNKKAVLLLVIREAQKRFVALPLRNA
jgi:serine protease Do